MIQGIRLLGEGQLQGSIAVLAHEELLEIAGGGFAVQLEGVLALLLPPGIVAV